MTIVEYTAINTSNKVIMGSTSKEHLPELEPLLLEQGLRLISYRLKEQKANKPLNYLQQQTLWMSLRYYMMSGFTLTEAMQQIVYSNMNQKLQNIYFSIHRRLEQGEQLSTIMKLYLAKDDVLTLSLLESAEKTGDYQETLYDLEHYARWQAEFKKSIHQSLRYPSIVFGAIWMSIFCMLYFFAPQLTAYFESTTYEIPTFTKCLIYISQCVVQWPWLWIALPFLVSIGVKAVHRVFPNSKSLGMYIPGIKQIIFGYYYASMAKVLYLHLKHGHSLINALKSLKQSYAFHWTYDLLNSAVANTEKGMSLSEILKQHRWFFSTFFIQLVDVGEQSNMLSDNFKVLSDYYEHETRNKITNAIKIIEPLILVVMGIFLIAIVGGLFYPMYDQLGDITKRGL